ncbi:signal recognition particle receptor subunit beta [Stomoxys calcitrans]|uniref:Signal recognition particle receptor subunit beta n=1 Tax=Stomoxys calcitrans TaxID=35570 RepID=A0A1I8PHD7_STOCA|nr:signal recognition particle receptor subunit beta [Stomoxys calcitrans]
MDKAQKRLHRGEPIKLTELNMTPILVALFVGFIAVALFVIFRKKSSARRDILLSGISEAGKSALFMQVLYDKFPETFTSMSENVGIYTKGNLSARLIDIPGHYRVRDKSFEKFKRTAKGIAFVVDSVTIQKEIRDVADALYSVLTDAATVTCKVCIFCNKQDSTTAKGVEVIKSSLEKELNLVRDTRSRKLQSTSDEEGNKPMYLGKAGRDFEWSHLQQNIQFYEGSAKDGEFSEFTEWIDKLL